MDTLDRRKLLVAEPNPDGTLDYLSTLEGEIASLKGCPGAAASIGLVYVPDKEILSPPSFSRYLDALAEETWDNLEGVAVTILGDINNEWWPAGSGSRCRRNPSSCRGSTHIP